MEQIYELAYLLSVDLQEEALDEITGKIETMLKAGKAKIIKTEKPRKIHLSYPIQGQEGAFLMSQRFQTEQGQITNFKQNIEKMPEIIRFLIVKRQPFTLESRRERPIKKEIATEEKIVAKTKPKSKDLEDIEKELEEVLK